MRVPYKLKTVKSLRFCVLSVALSGCAIVPNLGQAPTSRPVESYETQKSFTTAATSNWPESPWWNAYGDPQLTNLIDEALQNATVIAQAESRVLAAEAVSQQAGSSLYPNISANGAYNRLRQSYNMGMPAPEGFNDVAGTTLDLRYQLDFWGKNRALLAAATSEAEAAKLEAAQTRLLVSTSIASAYADLAQLYANLDAANDALTVRTKSATLVKDRQEHGIENKGNYEQEVAAAASAEAEIEALNESVALTKNRIATLMGAGPDKALKIARPDIQKLSPFGLPENLPAELLGRRPDIIAAKLRAEAALKRTDAAEASFYPNINLIGYAGHQAMGLDNYTSSGSLLASIGPTVSLPILDGGLLRGQYKQARAGYDAAVATYNATLQQALHEVADVVTSEKMLAPRVKKTEAAVKASEEAFNAINYRYKGGVSSYLAVLRSEDALIASRRALADLRTRAFTLDVALIKALGGGFTPEQKF